VGGINIAGSAPGQPLLHGSICPDITGRLIPTQVRVALSQYFFSPGIYHGGVISHRYGVNGPVKIFCPYGAPTHFKGGHLRARPYSHGITRSHVKRAVPYLVVAVISIIGVWLVKSPGATGGHYGGPCPDNIKLALPDIKPHGPHYPVSIHYIISGHHPVQYLTAVLPYLFSQYHFHLGTVNGNIPAPPGKIFTVGVLFNR